MAGNPDYRLTFQMKMFCSHNAPKITFNGNFVELTFKFILLIQDFILVLQMTW